MYNEICWLTWSRLLCEYCASIYYVNDRLDKHTILALDMDE